MWREKGLTAVLLVVLMFNLATAEEELLTKESPDEEQPTPLSLGDSQHATADLSRKEIIHNNYTRCVAKPSV